jgi:hypothetical protein
MICRRLLRLALAGLCSGWLLLPPTASACAACFGKSDSKMAQGMNMGIMSLLAVVVLMQAAVGGFFFVFLKKRAAKIAEGQAAAEAGADSRENSSSTQQLLS